MANQLVTVQGTETKWDALRRVVTEYAEIAGLALMGTPEASKWDALQRVLRCMDALEAQERDEPEPGLTEPEHFQVGEARHALVTFACTRDATSYSTERTLADHIGALLGIIDRLASQGGSNG